MKQPTWRDHYAPIIRKEIQRIMSETPDITMTRLRWLLGQINPGPYGHHKKTWANEATRQVNGLTPEGREKNRQKKKGPLPPNTQTKLF